MYSLASQKKRSSSSIGDCLAEGSARTTSKDKAHFINLSYSSAIETINHIIGAYDLQYITEDEYVTFRAKLDEITNKLNALRKAILK